MSENEIIGKLYVENQKQSIIVRELKGTVAELKRLLYGDEKPELMESRLRMKICDAQKYIMEHKDMVPELYYNEIMEILERRTDI